LGRTIERCPQGRDQFDDAYAADPLTPWRALRVAVRNAAGVLEMTCSFASLPTGLSHGMGSQSQDGR
jgi:hypothetical protein